MAPSALLATAVTRNQLILISDLSETGQVYNLSDRLPDEPIKGVAVGNGNFIVVTTANSTYTSAFPDTPSHELSIPESSPIGTEIGHLESSDPDNLQVLTYALVNGEGDEDNGVVAIQGLNNVVTSDFLDFETNPTLSIRVKGTDPGGLSIEKVFTISVTDVHENQSPVGITLDNNTIAENSPANTTVGTLTAIDPDEGDTHTFTLTDPAQHPDNAAFTIEGNQLKSAASFDFETKDSYTLSVQVTDSGGLTFVQEVTVNVTDVNEAPSDLILDNATIAENEPSGILVGKLSLVDPDGAFSPFDFAEGLVAYYPFNGNANDESGNGHHGAAEKLYKHNRSTRKPKSCVEFRKQRKQPYSTPEYS